MPAAIPVPGMSIASVKGGEMGVGISVGMNVGVAVVVGVSPEAYGVASDEASHVWV